MLVVSETTNRTGLRAPGCHDRAAASAPHPCREGAFVMMRPSWWWRWPTAQSVKRCPACGARTARVHETRRRRVRDLPSLGRPTTLVVQVRRFECRVWSSVHAGASGAGRQDHPPPGPHPGGRCPQADGPGTGPPSPPGLASHHGGGPGLGRDRGRAAAGGALPGADGRRDQSCAAGIATSRCCSTARPAPCWPS